MSALVSFPLADLDLKHDEPQASVFRLLRDTYQWQFTYRKALDEKELALLCEFHEKKGEVEIARALGAATQIPEGVSTIVRVSAGTSSRQAICVVLGKRSENRWNLVITSGPCGLSANHNVSGTQMTEWDLSKIPTATMCVGAVAGIAFLSAGIVPALVTAAVGVTGGVVKGAVDSQTLPTDSRVVEKYVINELLQQRLIERKDNQIVLL